MEGHELAVLRGGKKMFESGKVKIVQFEFGGCNIDSRTFFRDYFNFFKNDFKLYRILSNGLSPIDSYSEKLEVFQSANYLAIKNLKITYSPDFKSGEKVFVGNDSLKNYLITHFPLDTISVFETGIFVKIN